MSALQDIMDPEDVEPLEEQRNRRLRQATLARSQEFDPSSSSIAQEAQTGPSSQPPAKRQRSRRSSRASLPPLSPGFSVISPGSTDEAMSGFGSYGGPGLGQAGSSSSARHSSRGSEGDVRLTPVTGRVSRAKKGQPVHVCERCNPPRVFTRAEHLRRHTLGHDKPKYPCTFPECEKVFHRPDLLSRHMSRHDAGEKAYKGGNRSRSGSGSSQSRTPSFKVDTSVGMDSGGAGGSTAYGQAGSSQSQNTPVSGSSSASTITYSNFSSGFHVSDNQSNYGIIERSRTPAVAMSSDVFQSNLDNLSNFMPATPSQNQSLSTSNHTRPYPILTHFSTPARAYTAPNLPFLTTTGVASSNTSGIPGLALEIPDMADLGPYISSPYPSSESTWASTPSTTSQLGSSFPSRTRSASESFQPDWQPNFLSSNWSPASNPRSPWMARSPLIDHNQGHNQDLLSTSPYSYLQSPFLSPHSASIATFRAASPSLIVGGFRGQQLFQERTRASPTPSPMFAKDEDHLQWGFGN